MRDLIRVMRRHDLTKKDHISRILTKARHGPVMILNVIMVLLKRTHNRLKI